ncbi:MAG: DUF413 domain-containing protein [Motiliproteus sp.]|nr:DUF413 domain-containing protein [Motiliproteus sp.]MCW9052535.1 DUF413 domain-containing protein [Motiliproteus sp.]
MNPSISPQIFLQHSAKIFRFTFADSRTILQPPFSYQPKLFLRGISRMTKSQSVSSFHSERKFYDDANFPYGIERSGDFSCVEVNLLTARGHAYQGLLDGNRPPLTEEEESFVRVFHQAQPATTADEKVWIKYLALVGRKNSDHHLSLCSSTFKSADYIFKKEIQYD